jgi:phosphoserine aminotransferase
MTYSFSPGPAQLHPELKDSIQKHLWDTLDGLSILEVSHRSPSYYAMSDETLALVRQFYEVPANFHVIYTPFGAQQHFALLVDNFVGESQTVGIMKTCHWGNLAYQEIAKKRPVHVIYDDLVCQRKHLGDQSVWDINPSVVYNHITVNNTMYGTEYATIPTHIPNMVLDMTSSIGTYGTLPWDNIACVYASTQKNAGVPGLSILFIRDDFLQISKQRTEQGMVPHAWSYYNFVQARSVLNTPNTFAVFALKQTMQWLQSKGDLAYWERHTIQWASKIYAALEAHACYAVRPDKSCRSRHNIVFSIQPNAQSMLNKSALNQTEAHALFVAQADKAGLMYIQNHAQPAVLDPFLRISVYTGMPDAGYQALLEFIDGFTCAVGV